MIIVDLLCEYLRNCNFNKDGSPSNDDSYYKVVQIKTNRSPRDIRKEANKEEWVKEMIDSNDVKEIIEMEDYIEDSLRIIEVLSEVGHKC